MKELDDSLSNAEVSAERAVNAGLGGSCHVPIGVLAKCRRESYEIAAYVGSIDAQQTIIETLSGSLEGLMTGIEVMTEKLNQRGAQKYSGRLIMDWNR